MKLLVGLFAGFLMLPGGNAQDLSAPAPIIKTTTRLVQVSVIAREHNQPVEGLKAEDFHISVDGRPQKVSFFSMESGARLLAPVPPLPPNVYINTLPARGQMKTSVTILLLDLVNTRMTDKIFARRQMIKYLEEISPEERIGVYLFSGRLSVLHDYTANMADFQQKLAVMKDKLANTARNEEPSAMQVEQEEMASLLGGEAASDQERGFYLRNRALGTLNVLKFIANHLAELPGRKNLVWLSGGFPLQFGFENMSQFSDDFYREAEDTIRALSDANVSLYPIDAHGLVAAPAMDASRRGPTMSSMQARPSAARTMSVPKIPDPNGTNFLIGLHQTMDLMADRTGGHAFYNTNDLAKAIHNAVDDSALTYTLGFYPEDEKNNREFHKIKIEVDKPHVNLRYRSGYLDLAQVPNDDKTRSMQLHEASWSPLDSTELALSTRIEKSLQQPGSLDISVGISGSHVQIRQEGNRFVGRLDVLILPLNDRGNPGPSKLNTINLSLLPETYKKFIETGATVRDTIPIGPQVK